MRQVPQHNTFRLILPFFTVIILDAMSTGMMAPVLAPLVNAKQGMLAHHSLETRHLIYGLILGLWPLCFMLGAPIFGYISDLIGRKKVLLICLLGTAFSFFCYILSFNVLSIALLLLGRVIGGITSGSQGVAQAAIADVSAGRQKAVNIGVIAVAMTIGLVLGPLLGGVFSDKTLVGWFSKTTPFYIAMLFTVFNLVILWIYLEETHVVSKPLGDKNSPLLFLTKLKALFKLKKLRYLLLAFFLFELSWSLYFQSLALLLVQKFHFSNHMVGIFASYVGLVLSLGLIFLLRVLVQFFELKSMIYYGLMIGAAALLLAFIAPAVLFQWIMAVPIALMVAIIYSALIAKASDLLGEEGQGLLMGVTDAVLALAFAITGFLSGVTAIISVTFPQLLAAVFMVSAALVFRKYFNLTYIAKEPHNETLS